LALSLFVFLGLRRPPIPTLFPYTTLFRSDLGDPLVGREIGERAACQQERLALSQRQMASGGCPRGRRRAPRSGRPTPFNPPSAIDRKSTRLNSSHVSISYAVFCLKKKKKL